MGKQLKGLVCEVHLTNGEIALIDAEDFERVNQFKWRNKNGYAATAVYMGCEDGRGKYKHFYMHRFVLNTSTKLDIDHADMNRLNNQKANLRFCSRSLNKANQKSYRGSRSKFKGVRSHIGSRPWRANIMVDGKDISLGCFYTEDEAARAYDMAAQQYYGEYARTNF